MGAGFFRPVNGAGRRLSGFLSCGTGRGGYNVGMKCDSAMRNRIWRWTVRAVGAAILGAGIAGCADRGPVYPGREWSWKKPEAAGFSASRLEAWARPAGGTGCIVHSGEMIFSWGGIAFRGDVASSCKPIYAYLVFKAIEQGLIGSLDDPILRGVPEIGELNADLGYKDREITFRHLLTQTSGYGLKENPGAAFAYNDDATGLLVWTLFYRVYNLPPARYDELLNGPLLGGALGFEDRPTANHPNSDRGRIRISARDMARFALLYLRGGVWNGKRLLREDLFAEVLGGTLPVDFPRTSGEEVEDVSAKGWKPLGGGKNEKNHLGCFGYYWWHNNSTPDSRRLLPDAPPGTFLGMGYGGRFAMVVIPEADLVVVWLDVYRRWGLKAWSPFSEVGRHLVNNMLRDLLAARTAPQR